MRLIVALMAVVMLGSCASLSKEECVAGNWEAIGFRDGTNGQYPSHIEKHAKACERVSVAPDPVAWEQGRQRGLPAYCVPEKAYQVGRDGWGVRAVCPAEQMPALRAANEKGQKYYDLTQDIAAKQREIEDNERRLVREEDGGKRAAIVSENRALRGDIRWLELRRGRFDSL